MRFLVIDDSMPMRRIITNVLARLGYTDVILVGNGREALKRLESETIDFIITDWFMPEMNGLDFVRAIRDNEATKDVPILIVTANGSRTDVAEALKLRINGYVLKPFTAELLKERIAAICDSRPECVEAERQPAPEPTACDRPELGPWADDETQEDGPAGRQAENDAGATA